MLPHSPSDIAEAMRQLNVSTEEMQAAMGNPAALKSLLSRVKSQLPAGAKTASIPSPSTAELVQITEAHLKRARELYEREKASPPYPYTPDPFLLQKFAFSARKTEEDEKRGSSKDHVIVRTFSTTLGVPVHVSRVPLEGLKAARLSSMFVRKVHKGGYVGSYLLCRTVSKATCTISIQFIVEDPEGNLCFVALYNYPGIVNSISEYSEALFPVGTVLALQEPLLKQADAGEGVILRVDCPSNVHVLEADHALTRGALWRTGARASGAAPVPGTEDRWKTLGNNHFKAGLFLPAAVTYSRGLKLLPTSDILLLNRSMAYLRLRYFGAALADTNTLLEREITPTFRRKALFRAAQAQYGLGLYAQSLEGFKAHVHSFPEDKSESLNWVRQCKARLREQSLGLYDWVGLFKTCQVPGFRPDVADFVGPIKVQAMDNRGGGRGMVATDNIKSGDLLLVSKAFVSSFPEDAPGPEVRISVNLITNESLAGRQGLLAPLVVSRLAGDPNAASTVYDLYAGPTQAPSPKAYSPTPATAIVLQNPLDFSQPIDVPRIEGAISFNVFGIEQLTIAAKKLDEKGDHGSGLFTLPSLFNHSCAPNAHRLFFGDVMIIRATCDVTKGQELFISYNGHGSEESYQARQYRLSKWLDSCQCSMCASDKIDGEEATNTRGRLLTEAKTWTTVSAARSGIKRIEGTYKSTPEGDSFPLAVAYVQLAIAHSYTDSMIPCAKAFMRALEYLGSKIEDKSTSGHSSRALPVSQLPETHARHSCYTDYIVLTCLRLADTFGSGLNDSVRRLNWQQAALWWHDKRFGGGIHLMKARFPDWQLLL